MRARVGLARLIRARRQGRGRIGHNRLGQSGIGIRIQQMSEEQRLKSSFELAMERLKKKDEEAGIVTRPLSDAARNAIAEVRRFYEAKIAEQEVLHHSRARRVAELAEREALDAEWRRERQRLSEECERKVEKIRQGDAPEPGTR